MNTNETTLNYEEKMVEAKEFVKSGGVIKTNGGKDLFSDGTNMGKWVSANRKKFSREDSEELGLTTLLNYDEKMVEAKEFVKDGGFIKQTGKELFSDGTKIGAWVFANRKKFSREDSEELGLKEITPLNYEMGL